MIGVLLRDFWAPIWPNLAASALTFVPGFLYARRQLLAKWERSEREHLTRHEETHRLIRNLSGRIDQQAERPTQKADHDDYLRS